MKKVFYLVLVCAITGLVGCKKNESILKDPVLRVNLANVQETTGEAQLHYSGTVQASQVIPLSFQTVAVVQEVWVNVGDVVRKGQILAVLDKTDAQNMYDIAVAKHKQAKDAYNRLKEVYDKGSLSEVKWVEMQTNLQQAESSVELAKNSLLKCVMTAPVNGVVGSRNIEPGMSSVGNLKAPIEIVKIENVYIKIPVPENEISKIHKNLKASSVVSALDNQIFEGEVSSVGVSADPVSRTYEVKVLVPNENQLLKPGMVCDVTLSVSALKTVLSIPYQTVDKDNNGNTFVYVVDKNKKIARKRTIRIGNYVNDRIEVLSGLRLGESLVAEGRQKLIDGAKIDY